MGTRCLTHIKNDSGKTIITMYRQFDGYPNGGHGEELAKFLKGMSITNGIGDTSIKTANGMGCLAGQVIAHFKTDVGGIYLYPPDADDVWEEYVYVVSGGPGMPEPIIAIYDAHGEEGRKLFEGGATEVLEWCKKEGTE